MRRFAIFLFVTFLFLPGPGGAEGDPVRLLWLIYEAHAFEGESGEIKTLRRWEEPVRIRLTGPGAERWQATVDEIGQWLSDHTGLPVETRAGWLGANMTVRLRSTDDMMGLLAERGFSLEREAGELPCLGRFWSNELSVIASAESDVAGDMPDPDVRTCLWEEMLQTMGLPGDFCAGGETLFCGSQHPQRATARDALVMRIHYDRRLRPGMTRAEAAPIVETIIREHLAAGVAWR